MIKVGAVFILNGITYKFIIRNREKYFKKLKEYNDIM